MWGPGEGVGLVDGEHRCPVAYDDPEPVAGLVEQVAWQSTEVRGVDRKAVEVLVRSGVVTR